MSQDTLNPFGFLNEEYTIETPENVTFRYDVAGIGSRFISALIDSAVLGLLLVLLNFLIVAALSLVDTPLMDTLDEINSGEPDYWIVGVIIALYSLINFILIWGYFVFFELIWNGQTPGKRLAGIRVIRMDGNSITLLDNVIRNLVRMIDFMPTGYGVGLITMFCNPHARRLGDYAAGTLVIREKGVQTFDDFLKGEATPSRPKNGGLDGLSAAMSAPNAADDPLRERFPAIQQLSTSDFELIADALHRQQTKGIAPDLLRRLAHLTATTLNVPPPDPSAFREASKDQKFLQDVAEAYRRYHR